MPTQPLRNDPPLERTYPGAARRLPAVLAVCPDSGHRALRRALGEPWHLYEARSWREALQVLCQHRVPAILCDRRLPDGDWRDVLSAVAPLPDPPRLIVVSPTPDEAFRAEVRDMGGYDVITGPLEGSAVARILARACRALPAGENTRALAAGRD